MQIQFHISITHLELKYIGYLQTTETQPDKEHQYNTSWKLWRRANNFPLSVPAKINFCLISEEAEFLLSWTNSDENNKPNRSDLGSNIRGRYSLSSNNDSNGIMHYSACKSLNWIRQCGTEQRPNYWRIGTGFNNWINHFDKSKLKKFIRFIQDKVFHAAKQSNLLFRF